jgi:uncharacterized membrane protein
MPRDAVKTVWLLLLLCVLAQWIHFFPLMPPVMASHFGGDGRPNGWMPRGGFFAMQIFIALLLHGIFLGVPALLRGVPSERINLPNRDYWLVPERRAEALDRFQDWFRLFGCVMFGFMVAVSQLALQANLKREPLPSAPIWAMLAGIFLFLPFWFFRLYRSFRVPD